MHVVSTRYPGCMDSMASARQDFLGSWLGVSGLEGYDYESFGMTMGVSAKATGV